VKRQFEVARLPAKPSDPAGTIHVRLTPKPGTRFASKFEQIDFWVDPASEFPIKIETLDPNETTLTTATLSDIKVNSGLGDGDFKLPQIDEKQWHIQVAPFED
jgi:outer membrane lipoprotein-sorting protein